MKRIIFIACIIPLFLYGQNPEGYINISLFDSFGNQIIFPMGGYPHGYTSSISDTTNQCTINAYKEYSDNSKIKEEAYFQQPYKGPNLILVTSWGGDFQLIIERQNNQNAYKTDSMIINLNATCNMAFWLDIVFKPGLYEILVCDTTEIQLEKKYTKKNGKYDITPKDWENIRKIKSKEKN